MADRRVGVIGGGTMGMAIVRGCMASGAVPGPRWVIAEPDAGKRAAAADLGVGTVPTVGALINALAADDAVLVAVKPQSLGEVAGEVRSAGGLGGRGGGGPGRLVISVLAGTTTATLAESLATVRVIRAMPNTPAAVGAGMTAVARGAGATLEDAAFAMELFAGVGEAVELDEALMDGFTAVAGSGPAYVFLLAECLLSAAVRVGVPEASAGRIVAQTIAGAAAQLAQDDPPDPRGRRLAVTSPGGTTAEAVRVFEEAGLEDIVLRAARAARDRGRALAAGG